MSEPLPGGDALLLESYKQPPLAGDHLIFTFWLVLIGGLTVSTYP